MKILKNELLSNHTTLKIGGCAKIFAYPETLDDILELLNLNEKHFILGNGSNSLALDEGYNGIIISLKEFSSISVKENTLTAAAGAMMPAVATIALENNLTGAEFLNGIPGTIGGGVFMNAGAFNSEIASICKNIKIMRDNKILTIVKDFGFSYRKSIFQNTNDIILEAQLKLAQGNKEDISSLMASRLEKRKNLQPLEFPNAGSIFKRPTDTELLPWQLIDGVGMRGFKIGGAEFSQKHSGFIINTGGATAKNVLELIDIAKQKVYDKYKITLETELEIIK
jgi:UDP-N-acetylmuramate dehydrogenase